jgi:hypothetical protein
MSSLPSHPTPSHYLPLHTKTTSSIIDYCPLRGFSRLPARSPLTRRTEQGSSPCLVSIGKRIPSGWLGVVPRARGRGYVVVVVTCRMLQFSPHPMRAVGVGGGGWDGGERRGGLGRREGGGGGWGVRVKDFKRTNYYYYFYILFFLFLFYFIIDRNGVSGSLGYPSEPPPASPGLLLLIR